MLEESNEVLEGIDRLSKENDSTNLCEELGDVLFQVALHSVIAEEEGLFTVEDVIRDVSSKMNPASEDLFTGRQTAGRAFVGKVETIGKSDRRRA